MEFMKRGKRMFNKKDCLRIVLTGEEAQNYLKIRGDVEFYRLESIKLEHLSCELKHTLNDLEERLK